MFERFRKTMDRRGDGRTQDGNGAAVRERERVAPQDGGRAPRPDTEDRQNGDPVAAHAASGTTTTTERTTRRPVAERAATEAQVRRREEFGGLNWGAAFFGWLVATGLATLLVAIVAAAGTELGLSELSRSEASSNAETIGVVGGALLVAILALAYFAGGYVAGRMSRFDGAGQGVGVWVFGLLSTAALAVAGIIGGAEYNVLEQLNLPRIPIEEGDLATGGAIALGGVLLGTLLTSILGGKTGQRYHRRVDAAGWDGR